FNAYNLNTAAFITSQVGELGPWPVQTGLCSLEEHRHLPIESQVTHYKMLGTIDDLIIGNGYASEDELKKAAEAFFSPHILLPVKLGSNITDLEKRVILDELHVYRGDRSAYLLRSTMTRVKYREEDFPVHITGHVEKGCIVLGNNNYGEQRGESQVILQQIEDDGTRNIVGKITDDAIELLSDLKPWSSFKFVEAE